MRFEEAYEGWQSGRLTQEEAARLLGVCERTFRRHIDRYEDEGLDGLIVVVERTGGRAGIGRLNEAGGLLKGAAGTLISSDCHGTADRSPEAY